MGYLYNLHMSAFFPSNDASAWIIGIFHELLNGSYASWDKVSDVVKEIWWIEFMKYLCWNPEHHVQAREHFMKLASKKYRPQRIGSRDDTTRVPSLGDALTHNELYRKLHTHQDGHEKA
ncbi:hypothetical protein M9H77_16513 [Catharanthus roseus]|uniref:Uncharacterized protein n=1 Tax=Catharanthus roseus TaxID=4058 RepID=A0ACC0B1Z5_CATRO|nr:hypothetical protein M9H77_16513 [Catharanthus roseus]